MLYLDTSVLVPLFVPESESAAARAWFEAHAAETMAISDWTMTEFASAMGIKVRDKGLKPDQARKACALMDKLAADSLKVFTPTRSDYGKAAEHLGHHALGLRAGDALHLAIATKLEPLNGFFDAEAYHQNYAERNPEQPYIEHISTPKVEKLRKLFGERLKADRR